jgi:hypothetical protein
MITFKDIIETKIAIKDAWEFKETINNTEASFDYMQTINLHTAAELNKLFGRFFNLPKKAVAHVWIRKNKYNANSTRKIELQLSKSGVGATSEGDRINVYDCLIDDKDNYYESKGYIGDIINDAEVYDKMFNVLSPKGQDVLKALKEVTETTKVKHPKSTAIRYPLTISQEETEAFGLSDGVLNSSKSNTYIELKDDSKEMVVEVKNEKKKENDQYSYDKGVIFRINSLELNNEKDFQYLLFIHYHLDEFKMALNKYLEKTKEHKDRWTNFKELINSRIAKYVILYKM